MQKVNRGNENSSPALNAMKNIRKNNVLLKTTIGFCNNGLQMGVKMMTCSTKGKHTTAGVRSRTGTSALADATGQTDSESAGILSSHYT